MISFKNVSKEFVSKENNTVAVKDVNLHIEKGDIYGIIGFSGAGKSTLVRCINLLEVPTSGNVYFDGVDLINVSDSELRKVRQDIGMIFQHFNLLAQRTILDNVCYPLEIAGKSKKEARKKAKELLDLVGLLDKAKTYPSKLSGGQKQRVAIARALATDPKVLLCDEATSALDPITTRSILELLKEINEKLNVTIVIITHEMKVVEQICNKVAVMDAGEIKDEGDVRDVFLNPKSAIAKKLILPDKDDAEEIDYSGTIRLAFDGQSAFEPVIATLALKCNTLVNILGANTKNIGGKAYGQMLIQLPEDEKQVDIITAYLKEQNIYYDINK